MSVLQERGLSDQNGREPRGIAGASGAGFYFPVPVSGNVCGVPEALSVATMLAEAGPDVVGLKAMVRVQDALAASTGPQVLLGIVNAPALAPEKR